MTTITYADQIAALRREVAQWDDDEEATVVMPSGHADALRAALATLEAQQWRPIETAREDGSPILGWNGNDMMIIRYDLDPEDPRYPWLTADGSYPDAFTHWMPRPAPPEEQ